MMQKYLFFQHDTDFGTVSLYLPSRTYEANYTCTISAQNGLASGNYIARFVYYSSTDNYWYYIGDGKYNNNLTFSISSNTPQQKHTLTVISNNPSMGSVSGGCVFYGDTTTVIKAMAKDGYKFINWGDGNKNKTRMVVIKSDTTFVAYFDVLDGIGEVENNRTRVFSINDEIIVQNAENNSLHIFNTLGQKIYSENKVASPELRIKVPTSGVYYVTIGNGIAEKCVVVK